MKTTKSNAIANILTLFLLMAVTFLISACAIHVFPRKAIPVKMDIAGPIETTKEVSLVNRQTESEPILISSSPQDQAAFADLQRWTDFIVSQLESELRKRGVQVNPSGDYTFNVSVDNVKLFQPPFHNRCIVYVRVEKSDGTWSKTFVGNCARYDMDRAIDVAVHRAIEAILKDRGFRNALSQ